MSAVGSRWGTAFSRWKYRFVSWFFDKPDALSRRVKVENELIEHFSNHTSPTPEACFEMAKKLGVYFMGERKHQTFSRRAGKRRNFNES
jgi:hypothetical protein